MAKPCSADVPQEPANAVRGSTTKRLLWFVGLWAVSVLALTVVSQIIRFAIMP